MSTVVCVINPDHSSGKTSVAVNLAFSLSLFEKKTIFIEFTPFQCLSPQIRQKKHGESFTVYDVFSGYQSPVQTAKKMYNSYFYYLQGDPLMGDADALFESKQNKESVLKLIVNTLKPNFDYLIIDTPPNQGLHSINALCASEKLLVPLECRKGAVEQLLETLTLVKYVRTHYTFEQSQEPAQEPEKRVSLDGIIFNKTDSIETVKSFFPNHLHDSFKNVIYKTTVAECEIIKQSGLNNVPAGLMDLKSEGATAYLNIASELVCMRG